MNKNFVKILSKLLKEYNLTQKDLAKELDLQEAVISHWLTGKAEPSTKSIDKLSKFFKVSAGYFFISETESEKNLVKEKNDTDLLIKLFEEYKQRNDNEINYLKEKIKYLEEKIKLLKK